MHALNYTKLYLKKKLSVKCGIHYMPEARLEEKIICNVPQLSQFILIRSGIAEHAWTNTTKHK